MQTSYKILADKTWSVITQAYALAQIVSPCVKPSYHHILERSPFAIPSAPSHLQSLSSGSLAIHLFQATISQTKQQKKSPSSLQMHHFPSLYLAPFAPPTHERIAAVYKLRSFHRDVKQITNRRDDVFIACLRSGHHPSLKQYLHRLDPSQDPICPNCQEEEQDLVHWLRDCPALSSVRQRVFGCHQGSLEWLATRPGDVVAYARKTLVNLDA